ncbi:hypothetical protein NAP1_07775 [Erythrobacter sp. NAP1]|uniref:TolB family protein n=1 Tax=Erythrobacter sp. NAP1 TaxID=237727 RepID=UPI0000686A1B|nr:PD40 domain-containing protein [Erythrobacter sp. NAP1]EAQ30661.1 hypothetical protein NAP1_07775 [Erythrobacter sp. NAP1]
MNFLTSLFSGLLISLGLAEPAAHAPAPLTASSGASLFAPEDLQQSGRITLSPAFTPDGNTIYFAQADCERIWNCPQLLMRSTRTPFGWSRPQEVTLPQRARVDWPSVSPDGRTLYFSWAPERERHEGENVYEDFDLFRLDLTDTDAVPQAIDDPDINRIRGGAIRKTRFVNNETAPVLTLDGDLYFWSERLDGAGLRDIYVARSNGSGGFERPEILPAPINNDGENDGSWVSADGRLMLLTTTARGSSAPANLHVSTLENGTWSTPRPLGRSVNTRFSEFAGRITPDGKTLVFTSDRPVDGGEAGLLQVWKIAVSEVPELLEAIEKVSE